MGNDVVVEQFLELLRDPVTAQGGEFLAIDEDRRGRRLARARQTDADIGVLAFPGPVHHATHHREGHFFDARVLIFPDRHLGADIGLNVFRQFLKHRAGGATAARTGGDQRRERSQSHGLEDFLRNDDFLAAVAARLGC